MKISKRLKFTKKTKVEKDSRTNIKGITLCMNRLLFISPLLYLKSKRGGRIDHFKETFLKFETVNST